MVAEQQVPSRKQSIAIIAAIAVPTVPQIRPATVWHTGDSLHWQDRCVPDLGSQQHERSLGWEKAVANGVAVSRRKVPSRHRATTTPFFRAVNNFLCSCGMVGQVSTTQAAWSPLLGGTSSIPHQLRPIIICQSPDRSLKMCLVDPTNPVVFPHMRTSTFLFFLAHGTVAVATLGQHFCHQKEGRATALRHTLETF